MASQGSFNSNSRSRSLNSEQPEIYCFHHEVAPLRTVMVDGPTKGRRFYGCSHWPRTCGFFKWADAPESVADLQVQLWERDSRVGELELMNEKLQRVVKSLKEKNTRLEEECIELAIQSTEQLVAISSAKANRSLYIALFLSWVFFAVVFVM